MKFGHLRAAIKPEQRTLTVDTLNNAGANDVFGMEMLYNESDGGLGNTALYNGNLSAIKWRSRGTNGQKTAEKSYVYAYDALDRLTDALYKEKGTSSWNVNVGAFDEKAITYDQSGNILTLKRNSLISGTVTKIDSLVYSYTGNRLNNVTDGTGSNYTANGYKNLAAYSGSTPYAYDENGNLVTDLKKGISNHYNILNRVDSIRVTAGTNKYIIYTYDAGGTLLRKQQYNNATIQLTTDYLDGFVFENDTLKYFATAEGRVRVNGSTFINEYVITDQQGNSRISFEDDGNGRALVRQENSYYPFGLIMSNGITPATQPNKKLYNGGSEWQNDYGDLPDYFSTFYRSYDQTLGRWIGVDPQPESAESLTPYQYAGNNPVMGNDPMGDVIDLQKEEFMQQEAERHAMQESQAQARMRASLQNEQDMMMQEGWNWMSEAYISMKQEAAAVATHTRQMAQLLGLVSADDFSADEYVRVQGTLLKEIKIKFGDPYSHRLGLLELQEQVYNLVNPNEVNRDYVNASRKIAQGVDLAVPIYELAKFVAVGEFIEAGLAISGASALIGKGVSNLAGRFIGSTRPLSVLEGLSVAKQFGFGSYAELKALTKGLGFQVHHLIEQRFATILGLRTSEMLSLVVTKEEHQILLMLGDSKSAILTQPPLLIQETQLERKSKTQLARFIKVILKFWKD